MAARWIVDVDGLGLFAVAQEDSGRCRIVTAPQTLARCERTVVKLRERDATRAAAAKREAGKRLARYSRNPSLEG